MRSTQQRETTVTSYFSSKQLMLFVFEFRKRAHSSNCLLEKWADSNFAKADSMKWIEWGFRPLLCTYRLNWARRTFWGWRDKRDDTAFQTHNSKFEPGGLRPNTLHLGHEGYPQYWIFTSGQGNKHFVSLNLKARVGFEPAISDFTSSQL